MLSESIIEQALEKFHKIICSDQAYLTAKQSGFIQRSSGRLSASHYLILLVIELLRFPGLALTSMTDCLAKMPGAFLITPQALAFRLGSKSSVRFLRRCYSLVLKETLKVPLQNCEAKGILSRFHNVLIEDSTTGLLHEKVSEAFRGVGGAASKAGFKIHLIWNCITSEITSMKLTGSHITDQSTCGDVIRFLKPGDLIIRDLGYYSIPTFRQIQDAGAYFLSRQKRAVCIFTEEGIEIENFPKYLDKLLKTASVVELKVRIGKKEQLPVRLIAHRVSEETFNKRMRRAKDTARRQGYKVTDSAKAWNRFNIFVTNAPEQTLAAREVATLYTLRWQIEIIFKSWKSYLRIDLIKGTNSNRIQSLILGRMIAILLISSLYSHLRSVVYMKTGREISHLKFTSWVQRNANIFIPGGNMSSLIEMLESAIRDLCKQKRSRLTTLELLEHCTVYDDLYLYNEKGLSNQLSHLA